VTYSYEYLRKIPWTKELKRIPDIVYAHHEVLSGTGYPLRLNEGNIPLLSKIMAIADMYDALTARDRPYKKAVAYEKALNIISSEVKDYRLDTDLFDLFVKGKVYRLVEEYTAMDEHN
jgi:HD-GYP domain-containing protein (c-di-GMP phosphodiesterase class II)